MIGLQLNLSLQTHFFAQLGPLELTSSGYGRSRPRESQLGGVHRLRSATILAHERLLRLARAIDQILRE